MASTFSVLARGDLLVLDAAFARSSGGKLRFCGRTLGRVFKLEDVPAGVAFRERDPVEPGDAYHIETWERNSTPTKVPATGELGTYFRNHIRKGGMWAADKATADACGVTFDPTFGGDYPSLAKAENSSKKAGA